MKPDSRFVSQPKRFWACVRSISEETGYTNRGAGTIKVPNASEIQKAFEALGLNHSEIIGANELTGFGDEADAGYLARYRADVLNNFVEPRLMDKNAAKREFQKICSARKHRCKIPMNKQKGDKKKIAFLTAITNMLIEENIGDLPCDYDPRTLTTVTIGGVPIRTMARRVDGAFPSAINPIAIWEIKEYYHTTTFGSRVADGVYETLLDGMELEELFKEEKICVKHCLMLDAHFTWWRCGRSYLCRIIDMLHMGYVDEVLFGREVIERLPSLVKEWVKEYVKAHPSRQPTTSRPKSWRTLKESAHHQHRKTTPLNPARIDPTEISLKLGPRANFG